MRIYLTENDSAWRQVRSELTVSNELETFDMKTFRDRGVGSNFVIVLVGHI